MSVGKRLKATTMTKDKIGGENEIMPGGKLGKKPLLIGTKNEIKGNRIKKKT